MELKIYEIPHIYYCRFGSSERRHFNPKYYGGVQQKIFIMKEHYRSGNSVVGAEG
jgi:hypothetical protein